MIHGVVRGNFTTDAADGNVNVRMGTPVEIRALATGGEARSLIRLPSGKTVRVPNEALLAVRPS